MLNHFFYHLNIDLTLRAFRRMTSLTNHRDIPEFQSILIEIDFLLLFLFSSSSRFVEIFSIFIVDRRIATVFHQNDHVRIMLAT